MNRTEATRGVSKSGEGEGHGASKVGLVASSAFTTRAGVRLITDVRPVSSVSRRQETPGPWVHSGLEHDGDLHRVLIHGVAIRTERAQRTARFFGSV